MPFDVEPFPDEPFPIAPDEDAPLEIDMPPEIEMDRLAERVRGLELAQKQMEALIINKMEEWDDMKSVLLAIQRDLQIVKQQGDRMVGHVNFVERVFAAVQRPFFRALGYPASFFLE